MKFFLACFVWFAIAFILGTGIWLLAVKGNPWLLAISAVAFVVSIWRIGCTTTH